MDPTIAGPFATPYDASTLTSIGPGTYTVLSGNSLVYDATVKSRINTGSPFTDGLNAQLVAVTKAKLNGTIYASIYTAGDSWTAGSDESLGVGPGFQKPINDSIIAAHSSAVVVEWIGPQFYSAKPVPVQYNNGVGGRESADVLAAVASEFGQTVAKPRLAVLMAGVNDARHAITTAAWKANIKSIITAWHSASPSTVLMVCHVGELPDLPTENARITAYNAEIANIKSELQASLGVTIYTTASSYGLVSGDMDPSTLIHPKASAYAAKVAPVMSAVILPILTGMGVP